MPVSMVCETTATVNAALHDSLATNCSGSAVSEASNASSLLTSVSNIDNEGIDKKLTASTKRVLQSKIDYEEVNTSSQTVLDSIKAKCVVINSTDTFNGFTMGNGKNLPSTFCKNTLEDHPKNNNVSGQLTNSNAHTNGYILSNDTRGVVSNHILNANCSNGTGGSSRQNDGNNNNNVNGIAKRQNTELPEPNVVLFPREKVRLGWRGVNKKWKPGAGLLNVGNTCYLNATLQAIFHVPALANWLCTDAIEHMERCNESESCIICAVTKTLQSAQGTQPVIRPYAICSRMKYICKSLVIGRQEDAHEFLRYLVEGMERCFLQSIPNFKQLDQYSKETTPINQILGGYLKSAVRCLACSHVSVTFQHFQDLLLDIRKGDTIEQALDVYFSRERLEDMGYKCESCRKKVSATKQFFLERAPYVLCVQLKRFSMAGAKINKQVQIKTRLDLTKFSNRKLPEPLTYRLVSLITHLGSSPNCGHYTAIGLTQSGTYYSFDDSSVYPCGLQNIASTNAYIIFYELDRTISRPEIPPPGLSNGGTNNVSTKENYENIDNTIIHNSMSHNSISLPGYNKPLPLTTSNSSNSSNSAAHPNKTKAVTNLIKNTEMIKMNYYANGDTAPTPAPSKNNCNYNTYQNCGMNGSLRFQDVARKNSPPVTSTNNETLDRANNINESSFSDSEDELSSIQKSTLPDMPKLFDGSLTPLLNPVVQNTPITHISLNTPIKSLQPYFSDSDDDVDIDVGDNKTNSIDELNKINNHFSDSIIANNRLESRSSSSDSTTSLDGIGMKHTNVFSNNLRNEREEMLNGLQLIENVRFSKPNSSPIVRCSSPSADNSDISQSSTNSARFSPTSVFNETMQSRDKKANSIDEIFNKLKKNSFHGSCSINENTESSSTQGNSTASVLEGFSPLFLDIKSKRTKRSLSTPPGSGLVETKTGIWQVTSLKRCTNDDSVVVQKPKTSKNPNNPFATKPIASDIAIKRLKLTNELNRKTHGNGYHTDFSKNNVVGELLKESHSGYGPPIFSWNGCETEIAKESLNLSSNYGGDSLPQANSSNSLNNHSIIDNNNEQLTDLNQPEMHEKNIFSQHEEWNEHCDKNCCAKDDMIVEDELNDKKIMAVSSYKSSPYLTLLTSQTAAPTNSNTLKNPHIFHCDTTQHNTISTISSSSPLSSLFLSSSDEQAVNLSLCNIHDTESKINKEDLSNGLEENHIVP